MRSKAPPPTYYVQKYVEGKWVNIEEADFTVREMAINLMRDLRNYPDTMGYKLRVALQWHDDTEYIPILTTWQGGNPFEENKT